MKRLALLIGLLGVSLPAEYANAQTQSKADIGHCPACRMMGCGMDGGQMTRGPMGWGMQGDSAFAADMDLVREMLIRHGAIKRTVTMLPNGIQTLTESDDPGATAFITEHVASMEERLREGRIFNITSKTLPVIFANRDKIRTTVQQTAKGIAVIQTSDDSVTVAALQAHALEVSELAEGGMHAMMRQMMSAGDTAMMGRMGGGGNGDCPMMKGMGSMMHGRDSVSGSGSAGRHHHR